MLVKSKNHMVKVSKSGMPEENRTFQYSGDGDFEKVSFEVMMLIEQWVNVEIKHWLEEDAASLVEDSDYSPELDNLCHGTPAHVWMNVE